MKLRKKIIALSLTVMAAISASLSISTNAASNHYDTSKRITLSPGAGNCFATVTWRKKFNATPVYLKLTNLGSTTVDVSVTGAWNESGLTLPQYNNPSYSYYGSTYNIFDAGNYYTNGYTLGNGQYLLCNWIYERGGYYAKPARLHFSAGGTDRNFNMTWSPDSVGSYTYIS